jgi:hypothetical protein
MEISVADVRVQVERILADPEFQDAARLGPALRKLLKGERVPEAEARELRPRLVAYYDGAGEGDPLIIQLAADGSPVYQAKIQAYQPTTGRKLSMLILCVIALVAIWAFVLMQRSK